MKEKFGVEILSTSDSAKIKICGEISMDFEEKEFAKILEKIECNPTDANAYHELGNFFGRYL